MVTKGKFVCLQQKSSTDTRLTGSNICLQKPSYPTHEYQKLNLSLVKWFCGFAASITLVTMVFGFCDISKKLEIDLSSAVSLSSNFKAENFLVVSYIPWLKNIQIFEERPLVKETCLANRFAFISCIFLVFFGNSLLPNTLHFLVQC